jgi:uncharacterized membrane protein YbhN (UPF0104 family)
MLVIALGLASLAVFVRLAEAARRGSDSARTAAVIEAAILIALASLGVLLAAALLDLKCDESCDENLSAEVRSGEWWHTLDAWQWGAQFGVAVIGLVAVISALVFLVHRRYRWASVGMVLAAGAFAAWAAFLAPLGGGLGI